MSWIKITHEMPDKPEVADLAAMLGIEDPDTVVGKLVRLWIWFDQHAVDGNASVTAASLIDRDVGVAGFASALVKVGWLLEKNDRLVIKNFDRHHGKSAKNRALAAQRQSRFRNAQRVTKTSLKSKNKRKEKYIKRNSEKSEEKPPENPFKSTKKIEWPGGDQVPEQWISEAAAKKPGIDWEIEGERFVHHHRSKGSEFKDWKAAWWTWVNGPYPKTPATPHGDGGPTLDEW